MAQQQQTVLRVETNVQDQILTSGTTKLFVSGNVQNYTYGGSGTTTNPITGYTTGFGYGVVTLHVTGGTGTFNYDVVLSDYTGDSIDFYTWYWLKVYIVHANGFDSGNSGFQEYAVSDINGSFLVEDGDIIQFQCGNGIPSGSTMNFWVVPDDIVTVPLKTYEVLDSYSDIPIKINRSFAELQDISKRNSDYSIGLQLPGSKTNNKFFQSYFNVDSQSLFFDVTKRVPCNVLINDQSYFYGYLRLNKVSVKDSAVEYDVTLYSNVGDLFGKMANNLLNSLNFNNIDYHFNHYFTMYNVSADWHYQTLQNTKSVPSLYMYPAVHNGYEYTGNTVNLSGSTVSSAVTRLYTTTTVGSYANYAAFTAAGGKEYYFNSPKNPVLDNQLKPALNVWGLIQLMFQNYGYTIKSDFFNTPWFKLLYTYGIYSASNTKFSYRIDSIATLPLEGVEIVFKSSGPNDYAVVCKLGTGIPCFCSNDINVVFQYDDYPYGIIDYPLTIKAGTTGATSNYGGTFIEGYSSQVPNGTSLSYFPQPVGSYVNFNEYDYVNLSLVIDETIKQIDFLSSIAKKFNLVFIPDPEVANQIIIEPFDYYIGTGSIHDWTDKISFDRGFTVEPALNFIESELIFTDLEDGDDGNKQFKDRNKLIYGELHQYNPTDFKSQTKKIDTIFGPEVIRKWDDNVGIPLGINYAGSSSQDSATNTTIYQYKGIKSKPKLLFNLGNFSPFLDQVGESYTFPSTWRSDQANSMFFRLQQSDGTNPLGETYAFPSMAAPSVSHTMPMGNLDSNKINNDSICNLFKSQQPVDIVSGQQVYNAYTNNSVYNLFYSNRINNLFDKNTRFLNGKFKLNLSDYINLKPQDLIKINEQYFTWNKIGEFNLTDRQLTNVELIQYNQEVSTYPDRYFFYKYCNETGSTIYKFQTYFNPLDNINGQRYGDELDTSLRLTYFYWSIYYDYMVGILGGNVSGITSSYTNNKIFSGGVEGTFAYNMWETDYDTYSISGISHTYDVNNIAFIDNASLTPSFGQEESNLYVWSNQFGHNNAFFNLAPTCAIFSGLCSTNYVTLHSAPVPSVTPAPTPTPTPTPGPLSYQQWAWSALSYPLALAGCGSLFPLYIAYTSSGVTSVQSGTTFYSTTGLTTPTAQTAAGYYRRVARYPENDKAYSYTTNGGNYVTNYLDCGHRNTTIGSVLMNYNETPDAKGTPGYQVYINNTIWDSQFTDTNNLYSARILPGDLLQIVSAIAGYTKHLRVIRRDYTDVNSANNNGIVDTLISDTYYTATTMNYSYTVPNLADVYNFEILVYLDVYASGPTPTPTPTATPTPTPTPTLPPPSGPTFNVVMDVYYSGTTSGMTVAPRANLTYMVTNRGSVYSEYEKKYYFGTGQTLNTVNGYFTDTQAFVLPSGTTLVNNWYELEGNLEIAIVGTGTFNGNRFEIYKNGTLLDSRTNYGSIPMDYRTILTLYQGSNTNFYPGSLVSGDTIYIKNYIYFNAVPTP